MPDAVPEETTSRSPCGSSPGDSSQELESGVKPADLLSFASPFAEAKARSLALRRSAGDERNRLSLEGATIKARLAGQSEPP
jgi:hypothetical protein